MNVKKTEEGLLSVQLIHPGKQKSFPIFKNLKIPKGYEKVGDTIIRDWNSDSTHYRKFIRNEGEYIGSIEENKSPRKGDIIYFWGEWEGVSKFQPLDNKRNNCLPNGIHEPVCDLSRKNHQNTDPYVYGDNFKYAICKQRGQVTNLQLGSLILFGTVYPSHNRFCIDTVFVVGRNELAKEAKGVSRIYKESTLSFLDDNSKNKLYYGQTWWESPTYFSYVPCRLDGAEGFERYYIDFDSELNKEILFSTNTTGTSFLQNCNLAPSDLWKKITDDVLSRGYKLGVRFSEPPLVNEDKIRTYNQPTNSCTPSNRCANKRGGCC